MPTKTRKAHKTKAKPRRATKARKTSSSGKSAPKRITRTRARASTKTDYVTYVYECTRPGCGYKIWREEKGETGQTRNDLKCPKCHHLEFRCLGKGDLPESFQVPMPANVLDLDAMRTTEIGSN